MSNDLHHSQQPLDDGEYPDDIDEDQSPDTTPCPECGQAIYDDTEQCPYCGQYVVMSTSPWSHRPLWWIILGLLGIVAFLVLLAM